MADNTVDQISTTFTFHSGGLAFCFRPRRSSQLTPRRCTYSCFKECNKLNYPICLQGTSGISQWVYKTITNSVNTFTSRMQWPSCLAFRKSRATFVLQQYVKNLVLYNSQYKVANPVLAALWLSNMFLDGAGDPQPSSVNTSWEGIHNRFVGPMCPPRFEPSMEEAGRNNQKPDSGTKFREGSAYAQQLEDHNSKFRMGCECTQNCWCGCDDPVSENDVTDSESDSYSQCHSYEECEYYETDSCVSDDCVEFSDDSTDTFEYSNVIVSKSVVSLTPEHHSNSVPYRTFFSEESGYCKLQDKSDQDCNNGTFDNSEVNKDLTNEILWRTFEEQALSPHVSKPNVVSQCFSQMSNTNCSNKISKAAVIKCQESGHHVQERGSGRTSKNCTKHVSFKSESELVVIHRLIAWSFAYRAARKGPWEDYARDRDRFARRIECCASILEPCLSRKISQYTAKSDSVKVFNIQ